jgi:hypothetical protein
MNIKSKLSSLIETTFGNTNTNSNCNLNSPQKSIQNINKISPDTKPVTYALPPNDFNKINLNFINSSRSKSNIKYINREEEKFNTNKQFQSPQITATNTKTELFRTFSTLCTSPNKLNDCLKLTFNRKSIKSPSKNINEVERKSFKGILYNIKDEETLENMIDKLKKRKNMDYNLKYNNNNVEIKYLKKELISSPIKYSINKPQAILSSNRFNYNFTINNYLSIKRET